MHPPYRARRILKWIGVGLSMLILVAWVTCMRYGITFSPTSDSAALVIHGGIVFESVERDSRPAGPPPKLILVEAHPFAGLELGWPERSFDHLDHYPLSVSVHRVFVPFWLLLLLTAILTAWLWHRDRRRIRPGCCLRCRYDLTGNTSGVCSECGEKSTLVSQPPSRQGRV